MAANLGDVFTIQLDFKNTLNVSQHPATSVTGSQRGPTGVDYPPRSSVNPNGPFRRASQPSNLKREGSNAGPANHTRRVSTASTRPAPPSFPPQISKLCIKPWDFLLVTMSNGTGLQSSSSPNRIIIFEIADRQRIRWRRPTWRMKSTFILRMAPWMPDTMTTKRPPTR